MLFLAIFKKFNSGYFASKSDCVMDVMRFPNNLSWVTVELIWSAGTVVWPELDKSWKSDNVSQIRTTNSAKDFVGDMTTPDEEMQEW
jgi:hypothetical protein